MNFNTLFVESPFPRFCTPQLNTTSFYFVTRIGYFTKDELREKCKTEPHTLQGTSQQHKRIITLGIMSGMSLKFLWMCSHIVY